MRRHLVTKESVIQMLSNPNEKYVEAVVGRALVVLLNRQTREESTTNTTRINNSIGFTGADARSGSITAKFWIKNKRLEPWMVQRWTRLNTSGVPRLAKYWRQLDNEAQLKQTTQQEERNEHQ